MKDVATVTYDERIVGDKIVPGDEGSEWPDREPANIRVKFTGAYLHSRGPDGPETEFVTVDAGVSERSRTVWLALRVYSEYTTFGVTHGSGMLLDCSRLKKTHGKLRWMRRGVPMKNPMCVKCK